MKLCTDVNVIGPWVNGRVGDGVWTDVGREGFGGVGEDLLIQWGIYYFRYKGRSIYGAIAVDDPKGWTKQAIRLCFRYPFEQLGVDKFLAEVSTGDPKSGKFLQRLGFKEESRLSGMFDDGDLIIYSITRDQCSWL